MYPLVGWLNNMFGTSRTNLTRCFFFVFCYCFIVRVAGMCYNNGAPCCTCFCSTKRMTSRECREKCWALFGIVENENNEKIGVTSGILTKSERLCECRITIGFRTILERKKIKPSSYEWRFQISSAIANSWLKEKGVNVIKFKYVPSPKPKDDEPIREGDNVLLELGPKGTKVVKRLDSKKSSKKNGEKIGNGETPEQGEQKPEMGWFSGTVQGVSSLIPDWVSGMNPTERISSIGSSIGSSFRRTESNKS